MDPGFAKSINGKLQVKLAYELFNGIIIFIQTVTAQIKSVPVKFS